MRPNHSSTISKKAGSIRWSCRIRFRSAAGRFAIALKLKGGSPAAETDTGVTLVRVSDLDRPQIRQVLFPDIQQYLTTSH